MGNLRKRGAKSWTLTWELPSDPMTGKRRQGHRTIKGSKRDAARALAETEASAAKGEYTLASRETVGQFLGRWLEDYARPNLAPLTVQGYEHIVRRHLVPSLGNVRVSELTPQHLQRYYAEKLERGRLDGKGGLSGRTVRHHHVTLHDALQTAVKWNLVARNVADAVDAPRYQSPEMKTFDGEELRVFLDAVRETPYYHLFYVALFTGLRRGELFAIRWGDVDLDLAHLYVNRGLSHLRDGRNVFRSPKSAKGRRMVALPPSAALDLREHRENQAAQRLLIGLPALQRRDLVFTRLDGRPMLPDTVTHAWRKAVRRRGFRGIKLHDARHTHASLLLKQGVHPKIVQERLGHATIATTLDTYSHVAPGLQEAAAQRFDQVLPTASHVSGSVDQVEA